MKKAIAISIVVIFCHFGWGDFSSDQAGSVIKLEDILKGKINWKTLPDSQLIQTPQGTKTIGEIKQMVRERQAARVKKKMDDIRVRMKAYIEIRLKELQILQSGNPNSSDPGIEPAYQTNANVWASDPPVIDKCSPNHAVSKSVFIIYGHNLMTSGKAPTVRMEIARNHVVDVPIQKYRNTYIYAQVPIMDGTPDYSGWCQVETEFGKSAKISFRPEAELEIILLSSQSGNFQIASCPDSVTGDYYRKDQYVDVDHNGGLWALNCDGTDRLWTGYIPFINGWVVDKAEVIIVERDDEDCTAVINNRPEGKNWPELEVKWHTDWGLVPYLWYQAYVYIKGPKGVPYK